MFVCIFSFLGSLQLSNILFVRDFGFRFCLFFPLLQYPEDFLEKTKQKIKIPKSPVTSFLTYLQEKKKIELNRHKIT